MFAFNSAELEKYLDQPFLFLYIVLKIISFSVIYLCPQNNLYNYIHRL